MKVPVPSRLLLSSPSPMSQKVDYEIMNKLKEPPHPRLHTSMSEEYNHTKTV